MATPLPPSSLPLLPELALSSLPPVAAPSLGAAARSCKKLGRHPPTEGNSRSERPPTTADACSDPSMYRHASCKPTSGQSAGKGEGAGGEARNRFHSRGRPLAPPVCRSIVPPPARGFVASQRGARTRIHSRCQPAPLPALRRVDPFSARTHLSTPPVPPDFAALPKGVGGRGAGSHPLPESGK